MYGITNSGSGSGGGFSINAAVLHVTAPFGSTVSISKGGVIAKTIGPGKAHTNADDENADYYFSITPTNYGTWTVTATLNSDSASDTVAISSNKQYDVVLSYRLYLYNRGTQNVALEATTNMYFDGGRNSPRITYNSDSMLVKYVNTGIVETVNKVNLTGYNTIHLRANFSIITGHYYIIVRSQKGGGSSAQSYNIATIDIASNIIKNQEKDYTLDISNVNGEYYVGLGEWADGSETCRVVIYEVYANK